MPNWCRNVLELKGLRKDLENFANVAAFSKSCDTVGGVLRFENLVPFPMTIGVGVDAQARSHWERENWGCVGGACRSRLEKERWGFCYFFETRWTPPLRFLEIVSAAWAGLEFAISFCEEMENFGGEAFASRGSLRSVFWKDPERKKAEKNPVKPRYSLTGLHLMHLR